jgi:hypothetical protein
LVPCSTPLIDECVTRNAVRRRVWGELIGSGPRWLPVGLASLEAIAPIRRHFVTYRCG